MTIKTPVRYNRFNQSVDEVTTGKVICLVAWPGIKIDSKTIDARGQDIADSINFTAEQFEYAEPVNKPLISGGKKK